MAPLDLQPTLTGIHISLRPLTPQDFEDLWAAASDPMIWAQHPDPARGTREGFSSFFESAIQSKSGLVAIHNASRAIVGCSRYSKYTPRETITIGYTFLARSHWGGQVNAEMKRLMLQHAFTDVPVVQFTIAEHNLRSRRAVEKLGAKRIGVEDAPRWGQIHQIYRLTLESWEHDASPGYGPSMRAPD